MVSWLARRFVGFFVSAVFAGAKQVLRTVTLVTVPFVGVSSPRRANPKARNDLKVPAWVSMNIIPCGSL